MGRAPTDHVQIYLRDSFAALSRGGETGLPRGVDD